MTNQQTNSDFFVNLFLGGVSKGISKTLQAPFERVQLLLQTQDANKKIQDGVFKRYNGIGNCFMRIPKEEGWMAFFRGNLPNVIRYFPSQIMNFAFKDQYRKIFSHYNPRTEHFLFFLENLASGGAAGATTLLVVYPLDFARVRLAVDIGRGTDRQFQGLWNCLTSIQKSDGYIGLYRGFGVSVLGIVAYRAIYFGAYDTAKATVFKLPQYNIFLMKFAVSYFVTFLAGALSYPLDTIRKRMMMQSGRTDVLYANSIDCAKKIFRIEGTRGFFKGFLMNFLQGFSGIFLMWFDRKS